MKLNTKYNAYEQCKFSFFILLFENNYAIPVKPEYYWDTALMNLT